MENNFGSEERREQMLPPTAEEARAVLDQLGVDGASLAQRIVTPWWYHVALGLIAAAMVAAQMMPGASGVIVIALGVVALPLLMFIYARIYGISSTDPAGPRSRRILIGCIVVLVGSMLAALVLKFSGVPTWWGWLPAAFAFVGTIVMGRLYDDVLRAELAAGDRR